MLDAVNNPEDAGAGVRQVPFARELYIERDDFMEDPPKKFFRLGPGCSVRLRGGYIITCTGFEKDDDDQQNEIDPHGDWLWLGIQKTGSLPKGLRSPFRVGWPP